MPGHGNSCTGRGKEECVRYEPVSYTHLMAKNGVDGVYNADPKINPDAVKYDTLTYMDLIQEGLAVMDTTATSMCMDNDIDLVVFNMNEHGNILKAVQGDITGTVITKERK